MTKREIKARIYLAGTFGVHTVLHEMPGEMVSCYVPNTDIGNTIVRALRERATKKYPSKKGVKP